MSGPMTHGHSTPDRATTAFPSILYISATSAYQSVSVVASNERVFVAMSQVRGVYFQAHA